jgi:tetratricopeptide (TPR) repeat protein
MMVIVLASAFALMAAGYGGKKKPDKTTGGPAKLETLPVTTASAAAAHDFENGMVHYENHRWNLALNDWRNAVKLDPKFALAYTWICVTTTDPAEESRYRAQAKASMSNASAAEQLMVRWLIGTHENHYVAGISAMNDLLGLYPRDKRLNFLFAYWLYKHDQYDLAEKLTRKALAEDSGYATAYNQMGYLYSRRGDYAKALAATEKYVKLLPNEPNPHDSYGEMLRFSGRFEEALAQYRMALKMDPTFYISQKELGETYALMGDGEKARLEYEKAIEQAPSNGLKAEYLQKSAMTYLRDRQYELAEQAFLHAAGRSSAMEQWVWEARAHRVIAMFHPDSAEAGKQLHRAEAILAARKGWVAQSELDEETARIWRVRVERGISDGDLPAAHKALERLEKMLKSGSVSIERTYHGAAGTLLVAEKKYAVAVPELEADFANPLSLKILLAAYEGTGATDQSTALKKKLMLWRIPSVEEALVVPAFHTQAGSVVSQKSSN